MMWKCCEEHVDLAIDMYVDEMEAAPEIQSVPVDKSDERCDFCQNRAAYVVGN
ncbi:CxxH/CxxC protein (TIGR04129 family) [Thermolongibacillus altinsuensis]|jgi:CxxH/CxxC protein (TIGR04129 family)|uniref:CxxH/CxxC protein (TIGR04129 family) n=2 Tax=Thermolongibacillus altinsuensis TaxID=575256 RepID=A0A4R1QPJ1_9BACL|nr:CxxH/CxxC protein (TIGR04129 family) [Thermolongibacillus altinsuensis]GMB09789.1 hypothetical protein B1no1_24990 [Thermolongibacillus altinsuensis]